ncbi:MAG: VWA domain-containing protein [Kiritimatiellae bacterium]|nr:VWA domain-containing protein [Kiritimatiellia bacterium]
MIRWGTPPALYLLWALIPVGWAVLAGRRGRERRLARIAGAAGPPAPAARTRRVRAAAQVGLWLGGIALLGLALARPGWGVATEKAWRLQVDILVVLDTSKSMLAEDVRPSRFAVAGRQIRTLVRRLRGERVGLLAFAGDGFLQCPLTTDYGAFLMVLDDVRVGAVPHGGTGLAHALARAGAAFRGESGAERVIVLISDGEDHGPDSLPAARELAARGIVVHALGIGTPAGALIPLPAGGGGPAFVEDSGGTAVRSALNETLLRRLANATGGRYARADAAALTALHGDGWQVRRADEGPARAGERPAERFMWFLAAAFLLLGMEARCHRGGGEGHHV